MDAKEGESLINRMTSREWKARQQAYKDATTILRTAQDENDHIFVDLHPMLEGAANDSNASANDCGIEMIEAWYVTVLQSVYVPPPPHLHIKPQDIVLFSARAAIAPSDMASSVAGLVASAAVSRGLAGRPASVAKAHAMLKALLKIDSAIVPVVGSLLEGTGLKKPKVPPECLKCLTAAYRDFGAGAMPNKEVLAKLASLLEVGKLKKCKSPFVVVDNELIIVVVVVVVTIIVPSQG